MKTINQPTQTGFTLIELLIVVSILGIIVAIAVPSYQNYTMKARRADATATLMQIASDLERCYTQYSRYDHNSCTAYTVSANDTDDFEFTITSVTGSTSRASYLLTATADAYGKNAKDDDCQKFTINHLGAKKSESSAASGSKQLPCW